MLLTFIGHFVVVVDLFAVFYSHCGLFDVVYSHYGLSSLRRCLGIFIIVTDSHHYGMVILVQIRRVLAALLAYLSILVVVYIFLRG